ncbi:glycoside hydrolase family 2 protein [Paenibacillus koleovorans]|uniref:glycoside hydrolase family 2 protein n=1 Tax=Paenibacillus koleovorans TaxID=121608 RepID=UPI000FDA3FFA|nr:glycoside hydrolase family 2 TIM barrel-domain containing protein [Paenibacillus koleovorans]
MNMQIRGRTSRTITSDWSFVYYADPELDESYAAEGHADDEWVAIGLPHTWSTYETTGELHPFIMHPSEKDDSYWWYGWGWYRKRLHISDKHAGKRLFLEFDGVMKVARVYVNGEFVGEHKGGYASFSLDVSGHVRIGGSNVIAVAVSNRRNDLFGSIPPMTAGNFNVYGGIYRDVRIVVKEPLHIPFQGSADHEGGTIVTTPQVSHESATVRVRTYMKNDGQEDKRCTLVTYVLDADEREAATMVAQATIPYGSMHMFDQTSPSIAQPKLWSPDEPNMYKVVSLVLDEDVPVDRYESPLGFRWFHWDYEQKRLFWNGELLLIRGTNRHQEYPWLGDAIPKWMHDMDLHDMRINQGHNFMRTCHYTQDKYVYDWCDRHGIIVCEEVPNIKNIEFGDAVQEQQVREMIRRDRNHPSIAMWSMGNETTNAADAAWAREEDDTRIIHYRHVGGRGEQEPHNHHQLEMENVLRCTIRGWYNADVKPLQPDNGQHTGHERWQHDMALIEGGSYRGRIDMNGVMWIYADHGADREYVNAPLKHVNPKGWVDAYRVPKLMYYLWQAHWCPEPMVYMHPYDWTLRYLDQCRSITVNSNCDQVELWYKDEKIGERKPNRENGYTVAFENVRIRKGLLRAIGWRAGVLAATHRLATHGEPAKLQLRSKQQEWTGEKRLVADRSSIALLEVDIVDEHDVHVFGATNELYVEVEGEGRLVSPSVYTSDIDKHEEMEGTMYVDAPVTIVVRTTNRAGTIRVTVSSPGLQSAVIELESGERVQLSDRNDDDGIIEPPCLSRGDISQVRPRTGDAAALAAHPMALPLINHDIDYDDRDPLLYERDMTAFLLSLNPHVQPASAPFVALVRLMTLQLHMDNGRMVADDFNFNIERYNEECSGNSKA